MATPHVTGTAALYLDANQSAMPAQVASALTSNATANLVTSPGGGSPNLLLYAGFVGAGTQPPQPVAPGAPGGLIATAGGASVTLSWTPPSVGTPTPTYNIYRGTVSDQETTTVATGVAATSYVDNNPPLAIGTTYYYKVSATNSLGEGPLSAEVSATPLAIPPPPAPTLTASQPFFIFSGVQLSWTSIAGATEYRIYRSTTSKGEVLYAIGNGTSVRDTGTTRGIRYYYQVTAVVGGVESPRSNESSAVAR